MKTLTIAALLGLSAAVSYAEEVSFTNTSGDYKWNTASNWSNSALPTSSDSVSINVSMEGWTYGTPLALESDVTVDKFSISANRTTWQSDASVLSGGYTINANSVEINTVQWFGSVLKAKLNVAGTLTLKGTGDSSATRISANAIDVQAGAVFAHAAASSQSDIGISANTVSFAAWNSTFKAVGNNYTTYARFGGITGSGRIVANDNTSAAHGYIELNGSENYSYSGHMNCDIAYWSNPVSNKKLSLIKNGSGTQYLTNGTKNTDGKYYVHLTDTEINEGKLSMVGKSDSFSLKGGTLEVYNGTATNTLLCDDFGWTNGAINLALKSASEHTSLKITNVLAKETADASAYVLNLYLDFTPAAGTYENLITYTSTTFANEDLIVKLFKTDGTAITDFNALASFGNSGLNVIVTAVPEPATIAAVLGAIAIALAAFRRRK